jgi:hypothetical protein
MCERSQQVERNKKNYKKYRTAPYWTNSLSCTDWIEFRSHKCFLPAWHMVLKKVEALFSLKLFSDQSLAKISGSSKLSAGDRPTKRTVTPTMFERRIFIDWLSSILFPPCEQAEGRPPGDGAVRAPAPGIHEKERHQSFQGENNGIFNAIICIRSWIFAEVSRISTFLFIFWDVTM